MDKDIDRDWLSGVADRTSVSVDEAVMMLMGWCKGPIIIRLPSDKRAPDNQDIVDTAIAGIMSLEVAVEDLWADMELALKEAKKRKRPAHVIAELRVAMENFPGEIRQAKAYLCAIRDELNEGDSSALRIDKELSTGTVRFITRSSFDRWAQDRFSISLATPLPAPPSQIASREVQEPPRVGVKEVGQRSNHKSPARQKLRAQERAILDAIADLELDPKCLQRNIGRQHGAKSLLKTKLKGHALFPSLRVFDKAWERMLGSDIAYADKEASSP